MDSKVGIDFAPVAHGLETDDAGRDIEGVNFTTPKRTVEGPSPDR
jgi:hypothetical protein